VPASYVSFLTPEEMGHAKIYGEHLPFLEDLKKRVDPDNVFKAAISYLRE
jgi:FAD/FMN-containing dehydrogenase